MRNISIFWWPQITLVTDPTQAYYKEHSLTYDGQQCSGCGEWLPLMATSDHFHWHSCGYYKEHSLTCDGQQGSSCGDWLPPIVPRDHCYWYNSEWYEEHFIYGYLLPMMANKAPFVARDFLWWPAVTAAIDTTRTVHRTFTYLWWPTEMHQILIWPDIWHSGYQDTGTGYTAGFSAQNLNVF
jgi:hypothetical protein